MDVLFCSVCGKKYIYIYYLSILTMYIRLETDKSRCNKCSSPPFYSPELSRLQHTLRAYKLRSHMHLPPALCVPNGIDGFKRYMLYPPFIRQTE